jgi:regulation of enolase protein 1 (concanavalin A-like superfamily)
MKATQYKLFSLTTLAVGLLALLAATATTQAQVVTNTFTNASLDLVTNGVIGSGFDGLDLAFGDVPGANNAGDGNGATLMANSAAPFTGFLVVQTVNSAWGQGGPGDDGFFAFNVVKGDFTVSAEVAGPYANEGYVFSGVMARAISDGTGGPYNPTGTNASENWVSITVFQEFGIATMSEDMTNGTSDQFVNTGPITNLYGVLADNIYLQIKRTGDVFVLSDSPDGVTWTPEHTNNRPDLHGAAIQVGIEESTFSGNSPIIFFTDYGLVGTNTIARPASDPTNILVSAPVSATSVAVSWTPAPGSDGSVVVIRANAPIIQSPYYGFSYVGNPTNGAVTNMGGEQQALYVGSGTNVTIDGLGGSNNVYHVAVYSYTTNGGTTPITYDTNPAVAVFNGPGTLASVNFTISPSSLPVNGYAAASVTATYTSGDSYDVSAVASFSGWDSTVIQVLNGAVTGLSAGSTALTATYDGISGTNTVTVHTPAFADNFGTPHNYVANGLPGTGWEGIYLKWGDFPGDVGTGLLTTACDADITASNVLTVTAQNTAWEGASDSGFFLHKYVAGDFQMAVHITSLQTLAYQFAGLMARAYNNSGLAGQQGAAYSPSTGAASENWVDWSQFDQYSDSTDARYATNGVDNELANYDGLTGNDYWLLMRRVDSTNFLFYRRVNATDSWVPQTNQTIVRSDFNGVPLQAGLFEAMFTPLVGTVQFDSFMLDASNLDAGGPPPSACSNLVTTLNADFSITLTWSPGTNVNNSEATSFVVGRDGAPVNQQPPYGFLSTANSQFGQGTDLGGGNFVLFRGVGDTVTVTGLKPGDIYYFAVYDYSSSSTTKVFDLETAAAGSIQDGNPTNMVVSLPVPSIPSFGIGLPNVNLVFPGNVLGSANVAQYSTMTSANTNIAVAAGGVITGVSPGTTSIQVVYAVGTNQFTNTVQVTVHAPAFSDNFTTAHDYLNNGVTNTTWDGVYAYPNFTIPGTGFTSDPAAAILGADADITTNGTLTVSNINVGWEFDQNDGFFLFKYVPADFQMQVHLVNFNAFTSPNPAYDNPGLMARLYSTDTNGAIGAPFAANAPGTNGLPVPNGEDWVSWTRFDQYGIGTYARAEIDNAKVVSSTQTDAGSGQFWLLLVRQQGTNFSFYQKANQTDPWVPAPSGVTYANAVYANQPLQVGIIACAYDSGLVQVDQFDHFALDVSGAFALTFTQSGLNLVLSWPDQPGIVVQSTASLTPAKWQPVTSPTPTVTNGVASVTLPIGSQNAFFRLSEATP